MKRVALIAFVLAPFAAAPAGQAIPPQVRSLPWPPAVLPKTPPLAPPATGVFPLPPLFVGRIDTRERVVVGIDETGKPRSVRVLQGIVLKRLGDYVFAVPAPVQLVSPGPGTESNPGQRENQILWEGFSPGRRVLAAWADLRIGDSVSALPVEVRVEDGTLTVRNVTAATVRSFTGEPDPVSLRQVLGRIRAAIRRGISAEGLNVGFYGKTPPVPVRVAAPLRVTGAVGGTRVAALLDGIRRTELRVRLPAGPSPKVELRVETAPVADTVRSGQDLRTRLAETIRLELTYARVRQYDMFLASPDQQGPSSATYVYRTTAPPQVAAASGPGESDHTLAWILLGLGLAATLPAAAVIWAYS